jgi:hypothetical protein
MFESGQIKPMKKMWYFNFIIFKLIMTHKCFHFIIVKYEMIQNKCSSKFSVNVLPLMVGLSNQADWYIIGNAGEI